MENAQTMIMERNFSSHRLKELALANREANARAGRATSNATTSASSYGSGTESSPLLSNNKRTNSIPSILEYDLEQPANNYQGRPDTKNIIRFQVVVWSVGKIDIIQGRVPVTFRVTIFWNDESMEDAEDDELDGLSSTARSHVVWQMHGRGRAFQKELRDVPINTVEVPPVSILNVSTFDTIGTPEVSLLREDTKLMRWTCMYRATLIQEHFRVDAFPHDEHDIKLKLAILAKRNPGGQWDRNIWKLGLATAEDSQGATRIPYGLLVDQVSIPEMNYCKAKGLTFDITPLNHGPGGGATQDQCIEIKLSVLRDSSYYDYNIMPILAMLNFVAISITALEATDFFQRGLLTMNIAFVEIGMRMTVDSRLPTVSYQIKMQRILNEYFFGLLMLVLESIVVYELNRYGFKQTGWIDGAAAIAMLTHNAVSMYKYYADARRMKRQVLQMAKSAN